MAGRFFVMRVEKTVPLWTMVSPLLTRRVRNRMGDNDKGYGSVLTRGTGAVTETDTGVPSTEIGGRHS